MAGAEGSRNVSVIQPYDANSKHGAPGDEKRRQGLRRRRNLRHGKDPRHWPQNRSRHTNATRQRGRVSHATRPRGQYWGGHPRHADPARQRGDRRPESVVSLAGASGWCARKEKAGRSARGTRPGLSARRAANRAAPRLAISTIQLPAEAGGPEAELLAFQRGRAGRGRRGRRGRSRATTSGRRRGRPTTMAAVASAVATVAAVATPAAATMATTAAATVAAAVATVAATVAAAAVTRTSAMAGLGRVRIRTQKRNAHHGQEEGNAQNKHAIHPRSSTRDLLETRQQLRCPLSGPQTSRMAIHSEQTQSPWRPSHSSDKRALLQDLSFGLMVGAAKARLIR
jgi:hypothetical protein